MWTVFSDEFAREVWKLPYGVSVSIAGFYLVILYISFVAWDFVGGAALKAVSPAARGDYRFLQITNLVGLAVSIAFMFSVSAVQVDAIERHHAQDRVNKLTNELRQADEIARLHEMSRLPPESIVEAKDRVQRISMHLAKAHFDVSLETPNTVYFVLGLLTFLYAAVSIMGISYGFTRMNYNPFSQLKT